MLKDIVLIITFLREVITFVRYLAGLDEAGRQKELERLKDAQDHFKKTGRPKW